MHYHPISNLNMISQITLEWHSWFLVYHLDQRLTTNLNLALVPWWYLIHQVSVTRKFNSTEICLNTNRNLSKWWPNLIKGLITWNKALWKKMVWKNYYFKHWQTLTYFLKFKVRLILSYTMTTVRYFFKTTFGSCKLEQGLNKEKYFSKLNCFY